MLLMSLVSKFTAIYRQHLISVLVAVVDPGGLAGAPASVDDLNACTIVSANRVSPVPD